MEEIISTKCSFCGRSGEAPPVTESEAHLALGRLLRCLPNDIGRCPVCDGLSGWHTPGCGLVAGARAALVKEQPALH